MHVPKDAVADNVSIATMNVDALRVALVGHRSDVGVFDEAVLDNAVLGTDAAKSAAGALHELLPGVEEAKVAHVNGSTAESTMKHDGMMEEVADGHVGDQGTIYIVELEAGSWVALRVFLPWSTNDDVLALPGLATERDIAQWLRCLGTEHEIVGDMVFTCSEHDGLARLDLLNCLLSSAPFFTRTTSPSGMGKGAAAFCSSSTLATSGGTSARRGLRAMIAATVIIEMLIKARGKEAVFEGG